MAKRKPKTEQPGAEQEMSAGSESKIDAPKRERYPLVGERYTVLRGDRGVSVQWRADRGLVIQFSRPAREDEKDLRVNIGTCGTEEKDGVLLTYVAMSEVGARALRAVLDLALQEGFPEPPYPWDIALEELEELVRLCGVEEDSFALAVPSDDDDVPTEETEDDTPKGGE